MSWQMHFLRNTSKDIVSQPSTLYTDSTTLITGMTLYDNTGTDTGKTIFQVNQDGSFEIEEPTPVSTTYYAWGPYRGSYVYTTSATPVVGDKLYEYVDGNMLWNANSASGGDIAYADTGSVTNDYGFTWDRNSSEDITI